jgi:prophage DNA circulation protein
MGRRPYVFTFSCDFHDVPGSALARAYPNLYPGNLRLLREKFEKEITEDLVVPTIGTVAAVATSWSQSFSARFSSGESVTLEFIEDQDATKKGDSVELDSGIAAMADANESLLAAAALADALKPTTQSVFQDINDAITKVQAVFGQADAYSRLVEGKIQAVVNLCAFADSQLEDLQDPVNHLVLSALKDLWLASQELAENFIETRQQLREYRVPKRMSVQQVASTLFGTTERTMELLQLNAFEDALSIPPGTVVVYVA